MKNTKKISEITWLYILLISLCMILVYTVSVIILDSVTNNFNEELAKEPEVIKITVIQPQTTISTIERKIDTTEESVLTEETTIKLIEDNSEFKAEDFQFLKEIDNEITDIDDDQIHYMIDMCNEKGINPYLISSIIYTESRGKCDVYNDKNCRGYGGISEVAGRHIYTNVLQLGEYNHDYAFDPYINLSIIINLIDWLMIEYDGDLEYCIQYYSGTKGLTWYVEETEYNLDRFGKTNLETVKNEWITHYKYRI